MKEYSGFLFVSIGFIFYLIIFMFLIKSHGEFQTLKDMIGCNYILISTPSANALPRV